MNTDCPSEAWVNNVCSHCGSIKPDVFLHAARTGSELTPTGSPYKVYVDLPNALQAKFRFHHFNDAQRTEFLSLLRADRLKIDGSFHVLPFFAK